ncbi:uncharacterized protein L203_101638 [Cryptococcus depauperatus CBS 7841]|uniref:Uncharacterized protein n=1 Tax=Cryptococcus depauperatus CBS 7841 TaxID=1295531 RepID=A0AAJ8JQC2_9TREE
MLYKGKSQLFVLSRRQAGWVFVDESQLEMRKTVIRRQVRPEAILIVLFLVIAVYVLMRGKKSSGKRDRGRYDEHGDGDGQSNREDLKNDSETEAAPPPSVPRNSSSFPPLAKYEFDEKKLPGTLWKRDKNQRPQRPSGRSPPILLKRKKDGSWERGPLGRKGVAFIGNEDGKDADGMVVYDTNAQSTRLYDQKEEEDFKKYKSKEQVLGPDIYKLDKSLSPFIALQKRDLLHPRVSQDTMAAALQDEWVDGVGAIPKVIGEIIRQMIKEKQADVTKVLQELSCPNPEFYDKKYTVKGSAGQWANEFMDWFLRSGFGANELSSELRLKEWQKMDSKQIRERVAKWVSNVEKNNPRKTINLLVRFFTWYYRAEETLGRVGKYTPTWPKDMSKALGEQATDLLEWLKYIGKIFLKSRMFSPIGAEIRNGQWRVTISRRIKLQGFVTDVTIFTPEPKEDGDIDRDAFKRMIKDSFSKSLGIAKTLAMKWVEHLNEIYTKQNGEKIFTHSDPFYIVRLTFRPGLPMKSVNEEALKLLQSNKSAPKLPNNAPFNQEACIIRVSQYEMDQWYKQSIGTRDFTETFADILRMLNVWEVRFVNRRQYHWYQPNSVNKPFDSKTLQMLLLLCGRFASNYKLPPKFQRRVDGKWFTNEESVMAFQYRMTYGQANTIDFGGIIPIERGNNRFLDLGHFMSLKDIILPVVNHSSALIGGGGARKNNFPTSSALVVDDRLGLSNELIERRIKVIFHGRGAEEGNQLKQELVKDLLVQIPRWKTELANLLREEGSQETPEKFLVQGVQRVVEMIQKQISYLALGNEQVSAELKELNLQSFSDFKLPG